MIKFYLLILFFPLFTFAQTVINLQLDTFIRSVPEVGFNGNTIRGPSWVNAEFNDSVASMYPTVLSHPAGAATFLDWETGWFYPQSVLDTAIADTTYVMNPGWYNFDTLDLRAVVFQEALDQIGAEGLFIMNMMSSNAPLQAAALRAAVLDGVTIDRVELGVELNRTNEFEIMKYPTAGDYARTCNHYIDSIKVIFPDAEIAVVGENRGPDSTRSWRWNDSIYAIVDYADALVWHPYIYLTDNDTNYTDEQVVAYPFYRLPLIEQWRGFEDTITVLNDYEIWITEHNLYDQTDDLRYTNTWAQVLILAGMNSILMQNRLVEMLSLHNVGGIFANFDALDVQNGFRKQGTGVYASIMHKSMWEKDVAQLITTPEVWQDSVLYYNDNGTPKMVHYPHLFGWKFSNTTLEELVLTNITADTLQVSVAEMMEGDVSWKHWISDGLFISIDSVSPIHVYSDTGLTVSLPPYSINVASAEICSHASYSQEVFICEGDSLPVGFNTYVLEGNYTDTLIASLGCDSVVQTQLNFHLETTPSITSVANELSTEEGMSSYQWYWNGSLLIEADSYNLIATESGEYTVSYADENGCFNSSVVFSLDLSSAQDLEQKKPPHLLKIVDVLGREIPLTKKQLLFYIYDDGKVEKRVVVE